MTELNMDAEMRSIVEALCSPACAGRRPGTPEGLAARGVVRDAMRAARLDPFEQPAPGCGGANVLATIPGSVDRWIVVGAHFDHLGKGESGQVYWGADDNAAAVAVLVAVGRALAKERDGRGVVLAAFDGEEPPYFASGAMGSETFLRNPPVPRAAIDFMVCLDIVGHRLGPAAIPDEVGTSLFALGAERSQGTLALVTSLKRAEPGLVVRPVDAEIIPPLSDYEPFWRAEIPFLFLSAGRSRVYHTPEDTPDLLDYGKIAATARWLMGFVRALRCKGPFSFHRDGSAEHATLGELDEILTALRPFSDEVELVQVRVRALGASCDRAGRLPPSHRTALTELLGQLETRLA